MLGEVGIQRFHCTTMYYSVHWRSRSRTSPASGHLRLLELLSLSIVTTRLHVVPSNERWHDGSDGTMAAVRVKGNSRAFQSYRACALFPWTPAYRSSTRALRKSPAASNSRPGARELNESANFFLYSLIFPTDQTSP